MIVFRLFHELRIPASALCALCVLAPPVASTRAQEGTATQPSTSPLPVPKAPIEPSSVKPAPEVQPEAPAAAVTRKAPAVTPAAEPPEPSPEFIAWLDGLKREAIARKVRAETVERALAGVKPIERVIELDHKQPEFTQTFWSYLDRRVTEGRIERGQKLLQQHKALLSRIQKQYGVQPRYLVAFWGLETNFGDYTGKMPLIASLVTLAYDRRRSKFFREQLIAALQIMDRGDIPVDAVGSWAGAMGQSQFIPTTYREYAVDGDGDKRVDLWGSLPDVFASSSNYLSRVGWQGDRTWGREVRLPKNFDLELASLRTRKRLAEWQDLGVRRFDGRDLPAVDIAASVVLPAGRKGPAFLVYQNYRSIMVWNRSILYAIAVGHLSDRIGRRTGPFLTARPANDTPLARTEVVEIQQHLIKLGHYSGQADGIAGSGTRRGAKSFQRSSGMPPDGHLDVSLLEALRRSSKE